MGLVLEALEVSASGSGTLHSRLWHITQQASQLHSCPGLRKFRNLGLFSTPRPSCFRGRLSAVSDFTPKLYKAHAQSCRKEACQERFNAEEPLTAQEGPEAPTDPGDDVTVYLLLFLHDLGCCGRHGCWKAIVPVTGLCSEMRFSLQGSRGMPGAEGAEGKPGTQVPILYYVLYIISLPAGTAYEGWGHR